MNTYIKNALMDNGLEINENARTIIATISRS
jgi:hypothetical protein